MEDHPLRHARPHLEIHSRSKGHSAVAGAAYRLGLRLYDERLQIWHDYTRRAVGEEVVLALTVAPDGAPPWATDPAQLWNIVEAAEKRKDSQVARDYRIPIPLGLDDQRAGRLAEKLARFIMGELDTPVSVGLHRDAAVDALGQVKPDHLQGYHAHLYFPSRSLVIRSPDTEGGAEGLETSFGPRHPMLASKALGRGMVELFNKTWAELANAAAAEVGLPADYDHRSYERMGVPLTPQPTLGAGATALERKGFFTRKGDALREIVVMSEVYKAAHATALTAQQEQAVEDVAREAAAPTATPEQSETPTLLDRLPPTRRRHARSPRMDGGQGEPAASDASTVDTAPSADTPLIARFRATAPVPVTSVEHQVYDRLLHLLRIIERALRALKSFASALTKHEDDRQRRMMAKLDTDSALDSSRARRATADAALRRWEVAHPWQMMRTRAFGDKSRKPRQWRELEHEIQVNHQRVQDLKATNRVHQTQLADLASDGDALKGRQAGVVERLRTTVDRFARLSPESVAPLLAVLPDDDRYQVEELLPNAMPETKPGKAVDGPQPKPPGFRTRPSTRPIP
jgi:hypothetical protein